MRIVYRSFGGLSLPFDSNNNYINATALAKRYREKTGKRRDVSSWLNLQRTKDTIEYISSIKEISQEDLYIVLQGGSVPDEQDKLKLPSITR